MHHEIELKYRLNNQADYNKFLDYFKNNPKFKIKPKQKQINYFFDNPSYIIKICRMILRLREEEQPDNTKKFIMTVKDGSQELQNSPEPDIPKDPLVKRLECEFEVNAEDAQKILTQKLNPLGFFKNFKFPKNSNQNQETTHKFLRKSFQKIFKTQKDQNKIKLLGSYTNFRTPIICQLENQNFTIELDETHFPNGEVHHEVEIELSENNSIEKVKAWIENVFQKLNLETFPDKGKSSRFYEILIGN